MTANPVELIGGLVTTGNVSKADIVAWAKARLPQTFADPAEVNDTVMGPQLVIYVKSLSAYFIYDSTDTTTADNGTTVLLSADTSPQRYKIVSAIPSPTTLSLGGVFSHAAVSHYFVTGIDTDGSLFTAQPAASDLSNGVTGSGLVVLATAPSIVGGTHDALTSLGIRSTATAFDVKFASAETLSATRTLSVVMGDANRSVTLAGNLSYGGAFTMSGAYAFTGTLTGTTGVTFPTTGTLATLAGAETLTNKGINATNNTVTNLTTAMFATNVVDIDGTFAANSDTRLASQKATKTYMDQIIAAADAMVFKGVVDCSASPNYPAADRGWTYKVSVAGKIGGASGITVDVGDTLMCITDGTVSGNQATVGSAWNIVQANLVGAVTGPASSTSGNVATFNGTGGTVIQDSGKALPTGTIVGTSDSQALTGKTINGLTITTTTGTLTIANGKTATISNTLTFTGTDSSSVAFGAGGTVIYSGGAAGTPSSITLTNGTGLPISTGISGLGTGVATALAVNVGSAGAPVVLNGAGGTPSSLTLTNATGLPTAGLVNNAVTLAKLDTMATASFLGRNTASTGNVEVLSATQATALLNVMVGDGAKGLTPTASSGDGAAGKYLKADGTWDVPAGGGGGSLTDTDRQNILLGLIYQAKAFGGYRRVIKQFADGYKSTDGIGSSTNLDTSNAAASGYVLSTTTAASDQTATHTSATTSGNTVSASSELSSSFAGWKAFDKTTGAGSGANTWITNSVTTGYLQYQFGSAKTIASYTLTSPNGFATRMAKTWTLKGSNTGSFSGEEVTLDTRTGETAWTAGGQTRTYTIASPGSYTYYRLTVTANDGDGTFLEIDEMTLKNAASINDSILTTAAQTTSSSVSNARVLLEIDNTAAPALNTDLTVEVTCNGGTNWTTASASSANSNSQGGRSVIETVDQACTSGTSFAARIKTFSGKSVPLYGLTVTVH